MYEIPAWAATVPPTEYSLEILKEGSIIDKVILNSKCHFVIGRQADIVDIALEHPSISRKHAVLQFRDDDALMILDTGSAHGTYVNKKACVHGVYQRIFVGDIIKFGASSRLYVVCGPQNEMPEEYDSENMQKYREQLSNKSSKAKEAKERVELVGASWGFDEDAVNEDEDDELGPQVELPDYIKKDANYDRKYGEKYSAKLKDSEVHEKDKLILEKIRTKERKIQNMQEENRRIYLKENSQEAGLTEGQVAAVTRNDTRIVQLTEEIEGLEATILGKNQDRQQASGTTKKTVTTEMSKFENDDMIDIAEQTADAATNWRLRKKLSKRTKDGNTAGAMNMSVALTHEDLCESRDKLQSNIKNLEEKISQFQSIISQSNNYKNVLIQDEEIVDELEALMQEGMKSDAMASMRILEHQCKEDKSKLLRIQRLIRITTPAIPSLISDNHKCANDAVAVNTATINPVIAGSNEATVDTKLSVKTDFASTAVTSSVAFDVSNNSHICKSKPTSAMEDSVTDVEEEEVVSIKDIECRSSNTNTDRKLSTNISSTLLQLQDDAKLTMARQSHEENNNIRNFDTESRIEEADETMTFDTRSIMAAVAYALTSKSSDNKDEEKEEEDNDTIGKKRTRGDRGNKDKNKRVAGPGKPFPQALQQAGRSLALAVDKGKQLEGGDYVWTPPLGQAGDGKTSLNQKLGY